MLEQWIFSEVVAVIGLVVFIRTLRGVTCFREKKKALPPTKVSKGFEKNTQ